MSVKKRNILIRAALLAMLALVICLVSGCGQQNEPAATAVPESAAPAAEATAEPTEEPTEAPAEEPTAEPTEEPAAEPTEAPAEELTVAPPETPEASAEPEAESESESAVLLATVNGEPIDSYNEYLNNVIDYYLDYASSYGYDVSSQDMIDTINAYSLEYTIRSILTKQKANELGLGEITDAEKAEMETEAKADWASILESYAESNGLFTESSTEEEKAAAIADAAAIIKSNENYDEERYVRESVENSCEGLINERLMDHLTEGKTVSEEDVQNYFNDLVSDDEENYKDNIAMYEYYTNYYGQPSYYTPEGYRAVTHILLTVDEELLNTWKDLSARLEEQQEAEESEPTDAEEAEEGEEGEASAEETPAPADGATAEPTEEPTATPEPVTKEMVEAAEKAILDSVQPIVDEINAKLEAGASFEDLIKEYGTDPGMEDDSTRATGYYVHQDSILWDPIFTAAAMGLEKVGDVSKPVVSQFGVHIVNYLKDVPAGAVELTDEMKEEFRTTLLEELRDDALTDALDQWAAEADIVYTEAGEAWKIPEDDEEDEEAEDAEEGAENEGETAEASPESEKPEEEKPADETPAPEQEQPAEDKPAEEGANP